MRRRLLFGSAAILIGTSVFVLDRQLARVERSWTAMVAETERARDELEALPTERPVLWGEARPGNAEEDYERALAQFAVVPDASNLVHRWRVTGLESDPVAASEARVRVVDALAPAIEALREGAHRTQYQRRPDWSRGHSVHTLNLLVERDLVTAAVAKLALAKLEFSAQHRDFAGLPHAERDPLESRARDDFLRRAGPLGTEEARNFLAIRSRNESLALLRMSRMMLVFLLGEEPEPLPDPFGDELHTETRPDGSFRIWSDRPGHSPWELVLAAEAPASSPR